MILTFERARRLNIVMPALQNHNRVTDNERKARSPEIHLKVIHYASI